LRVQKPDFFVNWGDSGGTPERLHRNGTRTFPNPIEYAKAIFSNARSPYERGAALNRCEECASP
jgi:hypothetical protein